MTVEDAQQQEEERKHQKRILEKDQEAHLPAIERVRDLQFLCITVNVYFSSCDSNKIVKVRVCY